MNSYIDKNLLANEQVLYRAKLHWVVFLVPIIWSLATLFFLWRFQDILLLVLVPLFMAVVTWLSSLITYFSSEFGLTNKRVIIKVGFIQRNSLEVLLQRVESIQVNQGILGRILGFGSIMISGTGGTKDPFHLIADPLTFRKKVQEQVERVLNTQ